MIDKPATAQGYHRGQRDLVHAMCLYIATCLGDLMDEIVVVGGLVPSLLIDPKKLPGAVEPHVGTMDLDIGLTLGFLEEERYRTLTERLRRARLSPDVSPKGHPTRQRWKVDGHPEVTVDFLIPPSLEGDRGGKLRNIEPDFAALIAPGLRLAFRDRYQVRLSGETILGETAVRNVWVCGPGAYVILKALAFDGRGENKDAYDLYYLTRYFGTGIGEVFEHLLPLAGEAEAIRAFDVLRRDFSDHDAIGPRRVAHFLHGEPDDDVQADVVGLVRELLRLCLGE